jgi:eukaryotic-like serine/threonine-protein kinase
MQAMSLERPSAYERLSLEAAARVDALCDDFEKAWKATRAGTAAPRVSTFLDSCGGPERTVLAVELFALDRAWRERYGLGTGHEHATDPGADGVAPLTSTDHTGGPRQDAPAGRPADWPRVPGVELVEVIGSGGMGVVFKGRQLALDRDVAVKFLRDAHLSDSSRRDRFVQEARAVARMRHPHLVQLYEFGELPAGAGATSQPYLVLEYVSGGSLADLVRGSPQPPAEAARLVETAAEAIHYAHQQGVIHRDLKPANILLQLAESGAVDHVEAASVSRLSPRRLTALLSAKVTDFGLAKLLAGSDLTHSGDVIGTPSYMAPEQAAGKSAPLSPAIDVYGLGAILYEALTGRPPFAAATVDATLGMVRQEEPVAPRRLQPTVPRDLETICLKCLRKEPGRRYATALDLAEDLRRFRGGEPVRARPVGTLERVVVWCRRSPGMAALMAALFLVFFAGSSGVLWQWRRASRNAVVAVKNAGVAVQNAAAAEQNAAAFRRERDTARSEKARAERHLKIVRDRVDRLNRLGEELLQRPGQSRTGQAVLEQALAFYQEMLPEEGSDPEVRREAARLFSAVAWIQHTLGQPAKAAEAWGREASLLSSLLAEEPANNSVRFRLADSYRWRGNALRDLRKIREAREAYDKAATIHEALLRQSPENALYRTALANTLLNTAGLLSRSEHAGELEPLYQRIVELDRGAVKSAPSEARFQAELALALGGQGMLFLTTGRHAQAEAALREALEIHERVLAAGHSKNSIERYVARNYVGLGQVLAATGRTAEAEKCYRKAVSLLDSLAANVPDSVFPQSELANTLAGLADLLNDSGRREESLAVRRRVVDLVKTLKASFPDDPVHRIHLVSGYLQLVSMLWALGRQSEAAEPFKNALEVDPQDGGANNELAWFLATTPEPRLRNAPLAVRLATNAVAADPDSANYRNSLGVAHYRNGDDKAAVAELEKAVNLQAGGSSVDWFFLAMAYWRLGDRDKARGWLDRAVDWMDKNNPRDAELIRFRAEAEAMLADSGKR